MATVASTLVQTGLAGRQFSSRIAAALDRWIYVFMAGWFIVIALAGFVPHAVARMAAIAAGERPPPPLIEHVHAVLMASLLVLLLAQTILIATGRRDRHRLLGRAAVVLVPAIVVVMAILVVTAYHQDWNFMHTAPPQIQKKLLRKLTHDNTLLLQMREIVLFPLLILIALRARRRDPALHKRMMLLGIAVLLLAATDRMYWLPRPFAGPFSADIYLLLILLPMFVWDVIRNRSVPKAYVIWIAVCALVSIPVYVLYGTQWWFSTVPHLMRV